MPSFDEQMGKLLEAATEIGTKVIGGAIENGPQAMDMIILTYQYQGIAVIIQGFLSLIATVTATCLCRYFWKKGRSERRYDMTGSHVFAVCCAASGLVFGLIFIVNFFDKWAWVAAINPKLYMAHVILSKIGG